LRGVWAASPHPRVLTGPSLRLLIIAGRPAPAQGPTSGIAGTCCPGQAPGGNAPQAARPLRRNHCLTAGLERPSRKNACSQGRGLAHRSAPPGCAPPGAAARCAGLRSSIQLTV
jgi:hypothetical protein